MESNILKNKLFKLAFTGMLFGEDSKPRQNYENFSLPNDWQLVKLSELGIITSSKRVFQSEWTKSGVPFYRARDIVSLNKGNATSDVYISEKMYEEYSKKYGIPKENDILITGVGTIGESYIVKKDDRFYFKDGNIIWFKNNGSVEAEYLKLFFESPVFFDQIKQTSKGSTVLTLTITNANEVLVPLPSKELQNFIVKMMGEIKNNIFILNKKQSKLIEYKELLKKKIVNELILCDEKYGIDELGNILEYEQPTKYIVSSEKYNDDYDTPVLTAGKTFILGYTNDKKGIFDVLPVIIFDDFTTASRFVDFPFKVKSSAMKILKCKKDMNIKYYYYLLQSMNVDPSTHKRYWISEFAPMTVPVPPKEEQDKIVEKVEQLLNLIDQI